MASTGQIPGACGARTPARGGIFRPGRNRLPWLVGVLLLLAVSMAAPAAMARALRIQGFHAELDVLPDSSLDVTETIRVEFIGSWQGLYRTIPVEYPGPGGFNYSLFIRDVTATAGADGSGTALRVEQRRQKGNLDFRIYVPGASNATKTISLHYRVQNALRFFPDHDELYWNVTGNDWTVPIGDASAHITLPPGVTGLRAANYTGVYGSRSQGAQVEVLGSNVDVRTEHPLAYREGLTVVVGWDKGFVHAPTRAELIEQFLESNWPLFAPILALLGMFWLWYTRGRDPQVGAIAVRYEPPPGLTPGEMGTLVDDNVDMRDITASIVDLAVRGMLTIEERDDKHMMGLYSSKEFVFHLVKKPSEWSGLKPHELLLLDGLFSNGARDQVALSELHNQFYRNLPGIRNAIYDSLVEHGFYARRPDRVRHVYLSAGFIVAGLMFVSGQYAAQSLGMATQPFLLAAILTAGVVCGFGWFMPARTAAGVRAQHNALGFDDFLGHVEADRMDRMTQNPEKFEKYLPYAMALGVEKKWVGAFQGIFTQPPAWYQGPPGMMFQPAGFLISLDQMSARAGQMMTSAPRSSGSSGFGGGGSSGGGFGGGGGGGF